MLIFPISFSRGVGSRLGAIWKGGGEGLDLIRIQANNSASALS